MTVLETANPGAAIVADAKLILFNPNVVPVGVTNSVDDVERIGLMSKFVVPLTKNEHNTLAVVPLLYSAIGASCSSNDAIPAFEIPSEMSKLSTIFLDLTVLST